MAAEAEKWAEFATSFRREETSSTNLHTIVAFFTPPERLRRTPPIRFFHRSTIDLRPLLRSRDALDSQPSSYFNRELSWLEFNRRVLAQAEDRSLPLLERVKFVAIFSRNLDEFFQVRVGGLKAQLHAGVATPSIDGRTAQEQLAAIHARVRESVAAQEELYTKDLVPALADRGLVFVDWDALGEAERADLTTVFSEQISPILTPLAVGPGHRFPQISNLSLNLGVRVVDPALGEERLARLKVPSLLPRFLALPGERFLPIEQVIGAHLDTLFPGLEVA